MGQSERYGRSVTKDLEETRDQLQSTQARKHQLRTRVPLSLVLTGALLVLRLQALANTLREQKTALEGELRVMKESVSSAAEKSLQAEVKMKEVDAKELDLQQKVAKLEHKVAYRPLGSALVWN